MNAGKKYGIDISFEELRLPLCNDVLILATNAAQGKQGLAKSLDLLAPGAFQTVDTETEEKHIEAVFINRKLLAKISAEQVVQLLRRHVFPSVCEGELIQVTMKVHIMMHTITEG